MNKTNQIHRAEQNLKLIDGHTIVASKQHKRKTNAHRSSEDVSPTLADYTKPNLNSEFIQQLTEACKLGDADSKQAISNLAPQMAASLKKIKKWENPDIAFELPEGISIVSSNFNPTLALTPHVHDELIEDVLGPMINSPPSTSNLQSEKNYSIDINEACANLHHGYIKESIHYLKMFVHY